MPARPAGGGLLSAGQPTASQYSTAAQELRHWAKRLRLLIPTYEAVLAPATKLNNQRTWYGQYPDQVNSQVNDWSAKLRVGADNLLATAVHWEQLASTYEQHARDAHAAALKAQHQASPAGSGAK